MLHLATVAGVVAPRNFTPQCNFLAGGKSRRLVTIDCVDAIDEAKGQEAVYQFSRTLADLYGSRLVVDLGTGSGAPLHAAFATSAARIIQVDWRDQRTPLPNSGHQPRFIAANLQDFYDLEPLETAIDESGPILIILADVIEHLEDPRPLLRTIRRLLKRHHLSRLVASTPDRRLIDGDGAAGLPKNPMHVRQWTLSEFGLAMLSAGFAVEQIGWVPQNQTDTERRAICCELSCTREHYSHWLMEHSLPPSADHLVVTTEHGRSAATGGIGTYLQILEEIDINPRIILFVGSMGLPDKGWCEFTRLRGWLHEADLRGCGSESLKGAPVDADVIFLVTQQAIFIYDELRLIEYQDFGGIGFRIAQAKRAQLIPPSVKILAYAHGNHLYLDAANRRITHGRDPRLDVKERLSLELADIAAFPSAYIRNLYVDCGGFRPGESRILRIPFVMEPSGLDDLSRQPITTIVFFGKSTVAKGYVDFVEAVLALFGGARYTEQATTIKRIVLIGVNSPDPRLLKLPVSVEAYVLGRTDGLDLLLSLAPNSLIVLPYRGDNCPISILEVINLSCEFLAYRAGGIPEQIPEELQDALLCEPHPAALVEAIVRRLRLSHGERCRLVERSRYLVRGRCDQNTRTYLESIAELKREHTSAERRPIGAVTVTIPNLNGCKSWFYDLARGIRNSFHPPHEVILVDDGSTDEGFALFASLGSLLGNLPFQIIKNDENLGLAASRNVGLAACDTPYFCPHDNDNIVLNDFLGRCCRILDANPEVAAVTTWLRLFRDNENWETDVVNREYRPLGADLGLALAENCLGDALAVYRVSALREVGGWDGRSKAKFEDWELLLRLIATGHEVWVLPKHSVLYRVRNDSMVRAYCDFYGWLRLTTAVPQLSRGQAFSVARMIRHRKDEALNSQRVALEAKLEAKRLKRRLSKLENSTVWRSTHHLREFLGNHPSLRKFIRFALKPRW